MKTRTKILGAISIVLVNIVYAATPVSALTWNFTYTSDGDQFNPSAGYGQQMGSFAAPGSEADGTYAITEFQFTHSLLGNSFNVGPSGSDSFSNAFSSPTTVTISGGTVIGIDVIVNGSGSSFEMASAPSLDQVTLYNAIDAGGTAIDGSNFSTDTTFTPQTSGAGADYQHNPVPAVLIMFCLPSTNCAPYCGTKRIAMKQVSRIIPERVRPRLGNRKKHSDRSHINRKLSEC